MELALIDVEKLRRFDDRPNGMIESNGGDYVEYADLKTNVDLEAFVASLLGSIIDKRPAGYDKYAPFAHHEIMKALRELLE